MTTRRLLLPFLSLLAWLLVACGDNAAPVDEIEALTLTPSAPTVTIGASIALTATGRYHDGSRNVTADAQWTTGNAAIATVAGGRITGVAAGETQIVAKVDDVQAMVTVRVTAAAITAIVVTPPTASIARGTHTTLVATATFADGTTADVSGSATWSAAPAGLVTLDGGDVLGDAPGTATITATVGGVSGTSQVTVTSAVLTSLAVSHTGASIPKGLTVPFTATGTFSDGTTQNVTAGVVWTSSATSIATVSDVVATRGQVTGVAAGTATITATATGGVSDGEEVVISDAVLDHIDVTTDLARIAAGTTTELTATGVFSDQTTRDLTGDATWTTSATAVALVDEDGVVTGVAPGVATITAAQGNVRGTLAITVTSATLTGLAIDPQAPSLARGTSTQLAVVGTFSDRSTQVLTTSAVWRSSDTAVAVISNAAGTEGRVSALAIGTTTITAESGGLTATAELTVSGAVLQRLAITPSAVRVPAGTPVSLIATGIFTDGSVQPFTGSVTWTSNNETVAIVSNADGSRGRVSTLVAGEAVITASADSITASVRVTVTNAEIREIEVTPPLPIIANGTTQRFEATAIFTDETTDDVSLRVTWASSAPATATISNADGSRGLATSVAPGTTVISATLDGVTGSTTLQVSNARVTSIAIEPATATMPAGTERAFIATGTFSDGRTQTLTVQAAWSSSADTIARVANAPGVAGTVTAVAPGPATISATFDGVTGTAAVTVSPAVLRSIAIDATGPTLPLGATRPLTATGTYSDGSTGPVTELATWDSSAPTTLEVSNADGNRGLIRALAVGGPVTISAQVEGFTAHVDITVSPAALASITIAPPSPSTPVGLAVDFTATGIYTDSTTQPITDATWSSSNEAVATISNGATTRGRATPVVAGTTTIRATSVGVFGETTLRVTEPVVVSVAVEPATREVADGTSVRFTATATLDNHLTRDVTADAVWTASVPARAAVSAADRGVVTALDAGATDIVATFGGSSGTAVLTVTAAQACTVVPAVGTLANTVQGTDSHCYAGIATAATTSWSDARALCRALGGDLAVLDSARENELARLALPTTSAAWIGYNDAAVEATADPAAFVDVDGTAIGTRFHAFATGQPDNVSADPDGADCVALSKDGVDGIPADRWFDASCAQLDAPAVLVEGILCELAPHLIINEIDYDQPTPPTNDSASFVEVVNIGPVPANLEAVRLVYFNGNGNAQYGATPLAALTTLGPNGILVVANQSVIDALPVGVPNILVTGDFLQNGPPDGIAIMEGCVRLDSLSYEGPMTAAVATNCPGTYNLVEGTVLPTNVADPGNAVGSLNRTPNRSDTDNAATDWAFVTTPTPGV